MTNAERDDMTLRNDAQQGERVIAEVYAFLGRFVAYPSKHAHVAHALWCVHAHLMELWESTPRLAFLSPEPGSGKTRALEITELLVPNPIVAINVSPAYLFRKVGSKEGVTLLYDEIDTVFGPKARENEELRGLLNAGHRKGAVAGRCVVRGNVVATEEIPAYAAVALAGLGWLPDTILSRSVIIRMRRRHAGEHVEPYRRRAHSPQGESIKAKIEAWAELQPDVITDWPEMPAEIQDRDADVWEPLIAVADAVGGQWPSRARAAAVALVAESKEGEPSLGIRLLADLQTIFEGQQEMSSKTILGRLLELSESPWGDLHGKPLDERGLAKRLRAYGVKPKVIRAGTGTPRGYSRADLEDQWRRYLPSPSPPKPATSATSATSEQIKVVGVADVADVADGAALEQSKKLSGNNVVSDVADVALSAEDGRRCEHCRQPGNVVECHYGAVSPWLHRECLDGWTTAYERCLRDGIPEFLDRRR
jgi:Protein of unknown function (DUF3631)